MEKHLVKIRKAMLNSTFHDMEFSPHKKREVMESIHNFSNKKTSFFNRVTFLKPIVSVIACILFLGASSFFILEGLNNPNIDSSIVKSGNQINSELLDVEASVGNERKVYKPVSLIKAKEAVLFNYSMPTYLPFSEEEPVATITEWFNDKSKVSIDVKYIPNTLNQDTKYVELTISNFPNKVNSVIKNKDYHQEVSLNEFKAYLSKNKNVDMISWINNGIEYNLRYYSFKDKSGETSEELLKIAKSIK